MQHHLKENIVKNVLAIIVALGCYPFLFRALVDIEAGEMNNLLLIISILLVTVSFASFAFTYEKSRLDHIGEKYLAHVSTFIFLLLTGLLLETMTILVRIIYPSFQDLIVFFSLLLYLGIVLYDFWDILRAKR